MTWFSSPADAGARLHEVGYLADPTTATTAYLAGALEKPLLVEGPAGVGKTELAKAVSRATGAELVRLQCYEGLDEARALYEWNYKKQLLRIQSSSLGPGLVRDPRRHLHRRVPAHPAAADRDPARPADGAAHRRGRQDRRRGRGAAARGAVRLPGHHPRARHGRRDPTPVRRAHLQRHPRALRGRQAPLPLPAPRLPRRRARAGDRRLPGRRASTTGSPSSWSPRSAGCASWSSRRRRRSPSPSTGRAP